MAIEETNFIAGFPSRTINSQRNQSTASSHRKQLKDVKHAQKKKKETKTKQRKKIFLIPHNLFD